MTEYTTYVAFDGSEFDDEDDCVAYERKLQAVDYEGEIFFYDINRKPIPLYVEDLDDVYFINIKTKKAGRWFIDRCDDYGLRHLGNYDLRREKELLMTGFFWFSIDDSDWHHWQTEMESLRAIGDYFQLFEEEEEHCWDERHVPSQFELNP